MKIELDLSRLDQVVEVLGTTVPQIVAGIVENLTETIGGLQTELDEEDLERVAKAAHTCRNDALLVGAQPLLRTLTELEQAARDGRVGDARAAQATLSEVWPDTREALAEMARRDT
jgi:chemotaxis protein histidine kinase CheA